MSIGHATSGIRPHRAEPSGARLRETFVPETSPWVGIANGLLHAAESWPREPPTGMVPESRAASAPRSAAIDGSL